MQGVKGKVVCILINILFEAKINMEKKHCYKFYLQDHFEDKGKTANIKSK